MLLVCPSRNACFSALKMLAARMVPDQRLQHRCVEQWAYSTNAHGFALAVSDQVRDVVHLTRSAIGRVLLLYPRRSN